MTLAGSLSVALENARLVHETRQRNAELALINSVQEAIAGELDPQAIYDIVGDKIREVFDAQVVDIAISTRRPGSCVSRTRSSAASGFAESRSRRCGFTQHVLETREPLMINEDVAGEAERCGIRRARRRAAEVGAFRAAGDRRRATGVISLQNVDREHAFTEADQRLLSRSPAASASRSRTRASSTRPASETPSSR